MAIETFADTLPRWRRREGGAGERLTEVRVAWIRRTGRLQVRLPRLLMRVMWPGLESWAKARCLEAASGGLRGGDHLPESFRESLSAGMRDALACGVHEMERQIREARKALRSGRRSVHLDDAWDVVIDDAWDSVIPSEALGWISGYVPSLVGDLEEGILEKVRDLAVEGIREGWTNEKLAARLGNVLPFARHRLEAIARTESMRAYNLGGLISASAAEGVAGFEFSAVLDDRTSSACQARDGLRLRLGDPRLAANTPPLHPNCRSVLIPLFEEEVGQGWQGDHGNADALAVSHPSRQRPEDAVAVRKVLASVPRRDAGLPTERPRPAGPRTVHDEIRDALAKQGRVPPEFRMAREAQEWARRNLLESPEAGWSDFKGFDPECATEYVRGILRNQALFPELRRNFDGVGTCQAYMRKRGGGRVGGSTYAFSQASAPGRRGIFVNAKYGGDGPTFRRCLEKDVRTGFHPVGCDTVASVIDHEMGHQIDALLGLTRGGRFIDPVLEAIRSEAGTEGVRSGLSRYGASDDGEFFAEAWAEFLNNPTPRAIAGAVGERIMELWKGMSGS